MKRTALLFTWRSLRLPTIAYATAWLGVMLIAHVGHGQGVGKQEGKKAKPSMGNFGASGARPMSVPKLPAGNQLPSAKPQLPSLKPPTAQNSKLPQTRPQTRPQRPDQGYQKPNLPLGRPSLGNSKPINGSGVTKPNINVPSVNVPSVRPSKPNENPGANRPSTLPSRPSLPTLGKDRPSIGIGQLSNKLPVLPKPDGGISVRPETKPAKPSLPATRPNIPPVNIKPIVKPPIDIKPTTPSRPSTKPGIKPPDVGTTRPTPGTKPPSLGQARPKPLPFPGSGNGNVGNRPGSTKPNRPTNPNIPGVNRPGTGRPGIGGAVTLPGVVGGNGGNWGNNTNWGNNIQINNNVWNNNYININYNRPFWDRPQWNNGLGNSGWGASWGVYPVQSWHQGWYSHCVHPHYHVWYNGCWSNYWGSSWYAPVVWGGYGWGLSNVYQSYSTVYVNPYYVPIATTRPASIAFDYSQPIVVNNYQAADVMDRSSRINDEEAQALQRFDEALEAFQGGKYPLANQLLKEAIRLNGGDPVIHEVYALSLFAIGDYEAAAATLNALLASAPGMDWTSVSSLYGNIGDYTTHLRRLEDYCEQKSGTASSEFVLAYHYLVLGEKDAAIQSLQIVVENQPKDLTAKRMLEALSPPKTVKSQTAPPKEPAAEPVQELPQIDLVGNWRATKGDTIVELTITDESNFTWIASSSGTQNAKLEGTITTAPDGIVLETTTNGTLAGKVQPGENGAWTFYPPAASSEEGLVFERQD
ncbi:MAG: tetratricopeptide repeat protein [Pirellula sp.]|nr:tetratricopeptide repeat protein [Pirellula sp.]